MSGELETGNQELEGGSRSQKLEDGNRGLESRSWRSRAVGRSPR
ncbi:hypothetical protein [Paenibacillus aceti]|nr:hypothetical protein [Paenibacillus aceti]